MVFEFTDLPGPMVQFSKIKSFCYHKGGKKEKKRIHYLELELGTKKSGLSNKAEYLQYKMIWSSTENIVQ